MKENNSNPLMCDPENGLCEMPSTSEPNKTQALPGQVKPVKVLYFTDPICSACWGIEPQLRKLKLEYGSSIEIDYRMGGLLPDWSYNSGGISKPSDVAHHWDEVSRYYDMPIDGDVWLEDPLNSSYPPSIAFKAAQMQDESKALQFLRRIREMVFIEKKNIAKWEHLSKAAVQTGLDPVKLKTDCETTAKERFGDDLALAKKMGVRGFPTLIFIDSANNQQLISGFRPYGSFENTVLETFPDAAKSNYGKSWHDLFNYYPSLTKREFAELSGLSKPESEALLDRLTTEGRLTKTSTKNGSLYTINYTNT
jgi:putative protein-disulfide isomerase